MFSRDSGFLPGGKIFLPERMDVGTAAENPYHRNPSTASGPPPLSGEAFEARHPPKAPLKGELAREA